MKRIWIYDLETLDIFTATFVDRDSDEIKTFVISKTKDERKELFEFLNTEVAGLVGYNCIHFDAQILEYLYRYPDCTAKEIRKYATIITSDNNRKPDVPEWKIRIPHLDLFRALSLSVKAKRTGLKWCEFQIDFENIEDLPSDGDGDNWEEQVLSYNLNDVLATKALYHKFKYEIDLRTQMTAKESLNLMNSTEPDMAKKLFAKWLSEAMKIPMSDLYSMGTERDEIVVSDIIFPYIEFKTDPFKKVLSFFNNLKLQKYDKPEYVFSYQGIETTFALGGLHASAKNKIWRSSDTHIIKSFDATSYYPHLCFRNNLCPQHLPSKTFLPLYEGLFEKRKSIPKSDPTNYILKICLNSLYGMTNDEYSFLRDRLVTLAICINGQLLLAMLIEKLTTEIPNCQFIMGNTDGAEILMEKQYEDKYQEICKWWEKLTNIPLEHVEYKSLIIYDVNNYLGIYFNGKPKCKGRMEFENIPLHKNKSHAIIAKAVYEYFVNNISIEDTIKNHQNIFDFCAGVRARQTDKKGKSWYELHSIDGDKIKKQKLSKTVRYFISVKGQWLFKCYEDGSQAHVEAPLNLGKMKKDWKVTYFNKSYQVPIKEYNIDYSYYIHKAREWIYQIEDKNQLTLF